MAVHHRNKAIHEQDAPGEDDHELARDASESDQLSGSSPPLQNDNASASFPSATALRVDASELACGNSWASTTAEEGQDQLKDSKSQTSCVRTRIGSVPRVLKGTIFLAAIALGCFVFLSTFSAPLSISPQPSYYSSNKVTNEANQLDSILRNASMKDGNKTVIMTTLNAAWSRPNSIFGLFVESFRIGNGTEALLKHLVVICMDEKAYAWCSASHPHCYQLRTKGANFTDEAFFLSSSYLKMMWRRIEFLGEVLEMGYSFVLTDTDIMWLRNPFPRFFQDVDFQIACDHFGGNSFDLRNLPNGGFQYVRSNLRTIKFYKFWYFSRMTYPGLKTQDVLNKIKFDKFTKTIGLKIRFLDTAYFGGFCRPSKDLNLVCTMHANCCIGLENKINDLAILLEDWKRFNSLPQPRLNPQSPWSVPKNCRINRLSLQRMEQQKSGKNR